MAKILFKGNDFRLANILNSNAELIAIPVNTVGTPGAGLAKQFAIRFPEETKAYRLLCKSGLLRTGHPQIIADRFLMFPTKQYWSYPSQLTWIEDGLKATSLLITENGFGSIALPKLGCGCGELDWKPVFRLILSQLNSLNIDIEVYATMAESIGLSL